MNKDDLIFTIKKEQINNEMTKIQLNLRRNDIRGLSTTNEIVNCTPMSHFPLSKNKKQRSMFVIRIIKICTGYYE